MPLSQSIDRADAFIDGPFLRNPAGVSVLVGRADAVWMQLVAREMNLVETTFLRQEGDEFRLRGCTPTLEVDRCGHATLGSANTLLSEGSYRQGSRCYVGHSAVCGRQTAVVTGSS